MSFRMSDADKNTAPQEGPREKLDTRHEFPEHERSGIHEIDRNLLDVHDGWQPIRRKMLHERKLAG